MPNLRASSSSDQSNNQSHSLKIRATQEDLNVWLITLKFNDSVPESLMQMIRSKDFSDVFATSEQFFSFYGQLKLEHRVPFASCLDEGLLVRLLSMHSMLTFFQNYLTPELALQFLEFSTIKFDAWYDDKNYIAKWLTWFTGHWQPLLKKFLHIHNMFAKGVSLSDFLTVFSGDAGALLQTDYLARVIMLSETYPLVLGDIHLVLQRVKDHPEMQKTLFEYMFVRHNYYPYTPEDMIKLIEGIHLNTILEILSHRTCALPGWINAMKSRLETLPDKQLIALNQDGVMMRKLPPELSSLIARRSYSSLTSQSRASKEPESSSKPSTINVPAELTESSNMDGLDDLYHGYLKCSDNQRKTFLNAQDPAFFRRLCVTQPESFEVFFKRLSFNDEDIFLLMHRLFEDLTATPRTMAYFINAYQLNSRGWLSTLANSQLKRKSREPFRYHNQDRFYNVMRAEGGLAEFLKYFKGDFMSWIKSIEVDLRHFEGNWGDVFDVHQRLKHEPIANEYLTEWVLKYPNHLRAHYDVNDLFDVLSRLSVNSLVTLLNEYKHVFISSNCNDDGEKPRSVSHDYELLLAPLAHVFGHHPQFGRVMYEFYPDLQHAFWSNENPNHWLMLLSFLETPELISSFIIANSSKSKDLFELDRKIQACLQPVEGRLQQFEQRQKTMENMLFFWMLCKSMWKREHKIDASEEVLYLVLAAYMVAAMMGLANAHLYDHLQVRALQNDIYQALPECFPRVPLHQLWSNAKLLFEACQKIRQSQQRTDPRLLMQASAVSEPVSSSNFSTFLNSPQ